MSGFLSRVASALLEKVAPKQEKLAVVFPNKRSALFLEKELLARSPDAQWKPELYTLQQLGEELYGGGFPSDVELAVELWRAYLELSPDLTFEKFYRWGPVLLRDFDEADHALADPEQLFATVADWRKMEAELKDYSPEMQEAAGFWERFESRSDALRDSFRRVWEEAGAAYRRFNERLDEQNKAYAGKAWRKLAEKSYLFEQSALDEQTFFVFAGMERLSNAETRFIQHLHDAGRARLLHDVDEYYLNDFNQEAGANIRKRFGAKRDLPAVDPDWIEERLREDAKKIKVVGGPLHTGPVKALAQELAALPEDEWSDTAVVLPDESLLFSVLASLPKSVERFNVTMGVLLSRTPLHDFIEALFELQRNKELRGGRWFFKSNAALNVLRSPFAEYPRSEAAAIEMAKHSMEWVSLEDLAKWNTGKVVANQIFQLFQPAESAPQYLRYLERALYDVYIFFESKEFKFPLVEYEYLKRYKERLDELRELFTEAELAGISAGSFRQLVRQMAGRTRIPFAGEPLRGLQVIGAEETRNLDFKQVFVLSMNEGVFPKSNQQQSLIPFALRSAFGLPSPEEADASEAYLFYRLMQRAETITLFYNTETGERSGAEKSRYLLQLMYEWREANPELNISEYDLSLEALSPPKPDAVALQDETSIIAAKEQIYDKGLSPTAINTYLTCKFKFYLRYIAKLSEPEEFTDEIDNLMIGAWAHKTMELLYKPLIDNVADDAAIEELIARKEEAVDKAYAIQYPGREGAKEGNLLLTRNIVSWIVGQFLAIDQKKAPFTVTGAELKLNANTEKEKFKFNGTIDRAEKAGEIARVLDFKTGQAPRNEQLKFVLKDLFEQRTWRTTHYDAMLQALIYAWLYKRTSFGLQRERIAPEFYYARKKKLEPVFVFGESKSLSETLLNELETYLEDLTKEIISPENIFYRTDEYKFCDYCAYKTICNRH